jgi:predicted nuclease of predicted toxin-antitoxin system
MIRFLIDAQLPPGLARRLAARGYPSEHVNKIKLGIASDTAIWRHAARTGATLVTKDEDFLAFAARDPAGSQVVWIRLGNIANNALWRAIEPQLEEIIQALNAGEKVVEVI